MRKNKTKELSNRQKNIVIFVLSLIMVVNLKYTEICVDQSLEKKYRYFRNNKRFQSYDFFDHFIVPQRLTHVSIAKRKISKSNKSELWDRLSYRDLPYCFEIGSQTFRNDCKISRSQLQN